jgi:hypothetical protein
MNAQQEPRNRIVSIQSESFQEQVMTFQPSASHKKQRWLALLVTGVVLSAALGVGGALASIPAIYSGGTQVDVDGANDVPGQVDMTEMGRATSLNPDVRIFWSWDSTSAWTGSGQTGDACALFDSNDTDAFINYVVCARVHNTNANPNLVEILAASADHPVFLFDCSNKKNDRCTNPVPRTYTAGQVTAGPLGGTLTSGGGGNLISATDPFAGGESYPNDSAIDVQVASALVPTGVALVNVCSYPSAGNGGNNNPFDCILTPGVQYGTLHVVKSLTNDNGGALTNFSDFSFTVDGGTAIPFESDGTNDVTVVVGAHTVAEVGVPISGYTTTYANSANTNLNCTSLSVTAGGTTTCTITNNDNPGTLIVRKLVVNNSGGTKVATDFTFSVNGATAVSFLQDPNDTDTLKGENTLTVDNGTYSVTEPAVTGYTTTYANSANANANCTSLVIASGSTATCTITNNDNIGTPGISTAMNWTLNDSSSMTGWVSGGGTSTVTFTLYKDTATESSCQLDTKVGNSEVVTVTDSTGAAATSIGHLVSASGTYRWIASFSGNSFNAAIATDCTAEVTNLP